MWLQFCIKCSYESVNGWDHRKEFKTANLLSIVGWCWIAVNCGKPSAYLSKIRISLDNCSPTSLLWSFSGPLVCRWFASNLKSNDFTFESLVKSIINQKPLLFFLNYWLITWMVDGVNWFSERNWIIMIPNNFQHLTAFIAPITATAACTTVQSHISARSKKNCINCC